MKKFNIDQSQEINQYYYEHGYVIIRNLIEQTTIDKFIEEYNKFKSNKFYIFRAQDTNQRELLRTNKQGFIEHSVLDPKDLPLVPNFTSSIKKCLTSTRVSQALNLISNKNKHTIWQRNLFKDYFYFFRGYCVWMIRKIMQSKPKMEMRSSEYK